MTTSAPAARPRGGTPGAPARCLWCEGPAGREPARFVVGPWAFVERLADGTTRRHRRTQQRRWPACAGCRALVVRGDVGALAARRIARALIAGVPVASCTELVALFRVVDRALVDRGGE